MLFVKGARAASNHGLDFVVAVRPAERKQREANERAVEVLRGINTLGAPAGASDG